MRPSTLIRRNLGYYWRTNLAVVAGVAIAVAVLAGALLVGDSVRASLRALALQRLGNTAYVLTADGYFREQLATALREQPAFRKSFDDTVPLIALTGLVTHDRSRQRASGVQVYGVDQRFWRFHDADAAARTLGDREAWLSESLAQEFGAQPGDSVLVRIQSYSAIPIESLHGRKDSLGRTLRLRVRGSLAAAELGEFSLRPQQGGVRAVFVPLARLQRDLEAEGQANGILISTFSAANADAATLATMIRAAVSLDDFGLRLRVVRARQKPIGRRPAGDAVIAVESDRILLNDQIAEAVRKAAGEASLRPSAVLTYLANSMRVAGRDVPYSLVAALEPEAIQTIPGVRTIPTLVGTGLPPLWLNQWAEAELRPRPGDRVTLQYYLWQEGGGLRTATAEFEFRGTVPTEAFGADRDLAPQYPGITDADDLGDWDPPFPVDLRRVRPRDEEYWDRYRATPKALVTLEDGQRLWGSRHGRLTSLRLVPPPGVSAEEALAAFRAKLAQALDPFAAGFTVQAAREAGTEASRGAVDFGQYFAYFSFFLVVSAVLLTALFFRLGVEQRLREIGLLEAIGFDPPRILRLFVLEGAVLAVAGSALGAAGAVGYAALMMHGLRTWWVGAVGTTYLRLQVEAFSLAAGAAAGFVAGVACIAWTLWRLRRASPRSLLTGTRETSAAGRSRMARVVTLACAVATVALLAAAATGTITQVTGFFSAGTLALGALVSFQWTWLVRRRKHALERGARGLTRLGFRNAAWRPGRSLLCVALVGSATFILVAVDAFRHGEVAASDRRSGTGGYPLMAESLLPIPYDLNQEANRRQLPFSEEDLARLRDVRFVSFRLRPGEDTSCLNLYQPQNPRILGVPKSLLAEGRFTFADSIAPVELSAESPWRLLDSLSEDGTIPAIADATSLAYVLHRKVGEVVEIPGAAQPIRLRIVAALRDSLFQSELLISEENFLRQFGGGSNAAGYRVFLTDAPPDQATAVAATLEEALADYGFDVTATAERLAAYHRVENTYLSTFQALGGLGLLLGTVGLAAVMLRNVLERRRELALLRAVGYRPADLALLVITENAALLLGGLLSGVLAAALAIAPALAERGGSGPGLTLAALLAAVVVTGLASSLWAVSAATRAPLLAALRNE